MRSREVQLVQKIRGTETVTAVRDASNGAPLWACTGVTSKGGAALGLTAAVNRCVERGWVVVNERGERVEVRAA